MRSACGRSPRWALSFADLCLLLLGFSLLTQSARNPALLAASVRSAFGTPAARALEQPAAALFEPGEAVLRPAARRMLRAFARGARAVSIASHGTEAGAARFDGWELAAARTAAIAREIAAAGVPDAKIGVAVDPATGGGQRLSLQRG